MPPFAATNSPAVGEDEQNKHEVVWPLVLASKLSRRSSDGETIIGDRPSAAVNPLNVLEKEPSRKLYYKVFVSTWNVGGLSPSDDLNLDGWLDVKNNSYDIYVLGFQEIVELSAKNVLFGEKSRAAAARWNSLVGASLNQVCSPEKPAIGEKQKIYPSPATAEAAGFLCVATKQMVGILVTVWVRSALRRHVRRLSVSCIGCGVMSCLGNKGSVSVRFWLHGTSFCFVCCHLASGGRDGDEALRNADIAGILSRTTFATTSTAGRLRYNILHHDRIVLFGDLNYRISLPEGLTMTLVKLKDWQTLLDKDQLKFELHGDGRSLKGWREGEISFSPTYKYYPNSDDYYGFCTKKEKKLRAPAWCDRIVWHGEGLEQIMYERFECKLSDHRPVRAAFAAEVKITAAAAAGEKDRR